MTSVKIFTRKAGKRKEEPIVEIKFFPYLYVSARLCLKKFFLSAWHVTTALKKWYLYLLKNVLLDICCTKDLSVSSAKLQIFTEMWYGRTNSNNVLGMDRQA